jgi:hypothetical protein
MGEAGSSSRRALRCSRHHQARPPALCGTIAPTVYPGQCPHWAWAAVPGAPPFWHLQAQVPPCASVAVKPTSPCSAPVLAGSRSEAPVLELVEAATATADLLLLAAGSHRWPAALLTGAALPWSAPVQGRSAWRPLDYGSNAAPACIGRGPGIPVQMGCQADPAHVAVSPLWISNFVSNSSKVSKFCTNYWSRKTVKQILLSRSWCVLGSKNVK